MLNLIKLTTLIRSQHQDALVVSNKQHKRIRKACAEYPWFGPCRFVCHWEDLCKTEVLKSISRSYKYSSEHTKGGAQEAWETQV